GAVHDSVKVGVKRNGMAADCHPEIGGVGLALDLDSSQSTAVLTCRGEYSTDAFERAQIGVRERVIAFDGGVARAGLIEGPEGAHGLYIPHRFRIDQSGVKAQRLAWPDVSHLQVADVEFEWGLART